MPRVKKSLTAKAKHKKVLNSTKGHYGARSRLFRTAKQSNIKSMQYAFRDRKNKKRVFRSLWISRINSASRNIGISYSVLINGMLKENIIINRKILSDIAIHDSETFAKIAQSAVK
jgi:large subunit ribosomal protein L20